jgi:hypothetical protein
MDRVGLTERGQLRPVPRAALALLVGLSLLGLAAPAAARTGLTPTPAETWVLQQAAAGLTADLQAQFGPAPGARQLRGALPMNAAERR